MPPNPPNREAKGSPFCCCGPPDCCWLMNPKPDADAEEEEEETARGRTVEEGAGAAVVVEDEERMCAKGSSLREGEERVMGVACTWMGARVSKKEAVGVGVDVVAKKAFVLTTGAEDCVAKNALVFVFVVLLTTGAGVAKNELVAGVGAAKKALLLMVDACF